MDTEKLVRDCLSKCIHMSLGTCADNKPWVCEVHFAYDGELNLYYRSLESRRHSQEIEKNKYVAGNVVKQYAKGEPCDGAVYFEGTAKLLTPGQELDAAHNALSERLGIGDAELQQAQDQAGHQPVLQSHCQCVLFLWRSRGRACPKTGIKMERTITPW
jgi:uncharacterized protein YhbP (UPF0306 family)